MSEQEERATLLHNLGCIAEVLLWGLILLILYHGDEIARRLLG